MASTILGGRRFSLGTIALITCAAAAMAAAACAPHIDVRTVAAPDANFAGRLTFRILRVPAHSGGTPLASNDPMLENSITYAALRDEVRRAFESRGYHYSSTAADMDVAYYATAAPVLDVRTFDYGYDWRGFPRQYVDVFQYEQGTVIIDVIDPPTRRLLWRGEGKAAVSTDPNKYAKELRRAVDAIVKKFPPAR
ncbi:MAG: hypothetical protein JWM41_4285 [Gemmatimonadetes bacterium]|nr:hypothetical protein [Gemmatimonadota bacterium]